MNNEIKEILKNIWFRLHCDSPMSKKYGIELGENECKTLLDYITNLQEQLHQASLDIQELTERDIECPSWCDKLTNLQQENERLKQKLNCKEYFSSTMPENTEFVILTKNNYDRQQKDIELELIDYKSRIDKAVEFIKRSIKESQLIFGWNDIQRYHDNEMNELSNILNGRSDE